MKLCRPLFTLLLCLLFPISAIADQLQDARTAISSEDFATAGKLLLPLAEENDADAQTLLGALYINGQGVEKDFNKGLSLIMKAATKGHKDARAKAFMLCLELSNQGDTSAMFNVGYMCLNGWGGGDYNSDICLKWLENAGKMGHEKSSKFLAKIYTDGMFGITPDAEKANYWDNLAESFSAGIDGRWEGSLDMGTGGPPMEYSFDFKTDGSTLTGTTLVFGTKTPISDGQFDGTNISFTVKSSFGGMKSTTSYTGTFYGDTLSLTSQTETSSSGGLSSSKTLKSSSGGGSFPPVTFTVKRAG